MTLEDPIQIDLPASPRLQRLLRTVILYAAGRAGLGRAASTRLASATAFGFRRFARPPGEGGAPRLLRVSIEQRGTKLHVRIDPGRGRRAVLLQAPAKPPRAAEPKGTRKSAR